MNRTPGKWKLGGQIVGNQIMAVLYIFMNLMLIITTSVRQAFQLMIHVFNYTFFIEREWKAK